MSPTYTVLQTIGKGSYGHVRLVRRNSDNTLLVRKDIDYRGLSDRERRQLVEEVNILRDLVHPNIIRYEKHVVDPSRKMIYILMEYCSGGDLLTMIKQVKQQGGRVEEDYIWRIFAQLVSALYECHVGIGEKKGDAGIGAILHRDLKAANGMTIVLVL